VNVARDRRSSPPPPPPGRAVVLGPGRGVAGAPCRRRGPDAGPRWPLGDPATTTPTTGLHLAPAPISCCWDPRPKTAAEVEEVGRHAQTPRPPSERCRDGRAGPHSPGPAAARRPHRGAGRRPPPPRPRPRPRARGGDPAPGAGRARAGGRAGGHPARGPPLHPGPPSQGPPPPRPRPAPPPARPAPPPPRAPATPRDIAAPPVRVQVSPGPRPGSRLRSPPLAGHGPTGAGGGLRLAAARAFPPALLLPRAELLNRFPGQRGSGGPLAGAPPPG